MAHNTTLGKRGEQAAEAYLTGLGYRVLEKNYRYKRAEVDLIAVKGKVLALVEVKTRSTHQYGFPEEAVSAKKEEMLQLAAEHYIEQHQWPHEVRFDIVSVLWTQGKPDILHIEDAFH
ncbi:YraN family protein [Rufibacter glacialis]|uniref:UPF0102 protein ACD591_13965 n=1 Tax=Rufibacter glacialis TaxID=1259555 RepID=A0A5M8Q852_9BACT|nr:YraN family protein [Rufibacter glacialis]KAA6431046.1 YraN family protein [Rufibacter glacialis]GGK83554.1 UPF0102 protein [Rufibacter glacialis]